MFSTFIGFALAAAHPALHYVPEEWPGARAKLDSLADSTASAVVARATGPIEVVRRHAAHYSTQMAEPDGTVIRGGGMVFSAKCRQKFAVSDFLHGKGRAEDRVLEYDFIERVQGFPLSGPGKPIPNGATAILLLDEKGGLLKALPDTPENRKAVRAALAKKGDKKK